MNETTHTPTAPFTRFFQIREFVLECRDASLRRARKDGYRYVRHGNFRLIGCNASGRLAPPNDEPYYLDLNKFSKKVLKDFAKDVAAAGGTYIAVDGSVYASDELFGEYEPTDEGYSVDVPLEQINAL